MQSWPIIQPSIIIKGRTKRAIYILNLVTILIARLILSLQATVTAIIYSAAFPTIKSRIRLTKVVDLL
jgi:hypothetical protein